MPSSRLLAELGPPSALWTTELLGKSIWLRVQFHGARLKACRPTNQFCTLDWQSFEPLMLLQVRLGSRVAKGIDYSVSVMAIPYSGENCPIC